MATVDDNMTAIVNAPSLAEAIALAGRMSRSQLIALADLMYVELPAGKARAAEFVAIEARGGMCRYSIACTNAAATSIDCGPVVGTIDVCTACAELYARLSRGGAK